MVDLKKWFPFKFKRGEKKAETAPAKVEATPWSGPLSLAPMMQELMSDRFWRDPFALLGQSDRFFGDFSPSRFQPSVDVVDEGGSIKVTAELPGMTKDDLTLDVHDGLLTIGGTKQHSDSHKEEGCYRTERYFGSFRRAVPLPRDIAVDQAEADFKDGVLTVSFPKIEQAPSGRRIEVK